MKSFHLVHETGWSIDLVVFNMCYDKICGREDFPVSPNPVPQWKRYLDVSVILLAVPILVPLMVAVAILVRIVSEGPVFFRQERVGYLGRRFMCFKFRTMFVNADTTIHQGHLNHLMDSDSPLVKMDTKGDPRIIPFGRLLRATGLDELPQLVNVLRGEMSLVGPRPCLPYEYEKYQEWQKERFSTLPGLTGLWQVGGKNKTTFTEMICLDIRYARTKTLWFDLMILLKTFPAVMVQLLESREPKEGKSFSSLDTAPTSNLSRRVVRQ
jgi:lipopolysaccharide/colanic/teichoic acid biosynthesis glycosyltransferase